jgi:hypothetical protein
MGRRVTAVTPLKAHMKRNFCQRTVRMSGWASAAILARCSTSRSRSVRALVPPPISPSTILPGPAVCATTPGALIAETTYAAAPSPEGCPVARAMRSSLSTPFWSERSIVPGWKSERTLFTAASVS